MTVPDDPSLTAVRDALLAHFDRHRRALPWRETRDPYAIWVSEVMLQQTRVDTVVPYYTRFLARFPTVRALAEAPVPDVLALWSGLGYYRRARLLHAGARAVLEAHGGEVPGAWEALRALPGVGEYTAGAIGSIAFGLRVPVVDGNVERVLTRLYALGGDPRAPPTRETLWALARRFADGDRPGDTNQSLMELGATVCAPTAPRCLLCPVRERCAAHARGEPERFPEKKPRAEVRDEAWCALVARHQGGAWLVPAARERWRGMLLPPLEPDPARRGVRWVGAHFGLEGALRGVREVGVVVHVLTHARMRVRVFAAELSSAPREGGRLVADDALDALAVPTITRRLLALAARPEGPATGDAAPRSTPPGAARRPRASPPGSPRSPRGRP